MTTNDKQSEMATTASLIKEPKVLKAHDTPILCIPPGWTTDELLNLQDAPKRIKERRVFNDPASFAAYVAAFVSEGEAPPIFYTGKGPDAAAPLVADNHEFSVTFDGNTPAGPGHCDHRAVLNLHYSPEYTTWRMSEGTKMGREEFTRFIEQNLTHIEVKEAGMSSADILNMCRKLRVRGKGDIDVNEDLKNGVRGLNISVNHTVSGATKDGDYIPFPETIQAKLRMFRYCETFSFHVQLRWQVQDHELFFYIDMPHHQIVLETAISALSASLSERLKAPVWK